MKLSFNGAQGALEVLAFPLRLLAAIFLCTSLPSGAFAQGNSALHESQRAAQVRALNNSVLQLHGQIQENASGTAAIRGQAATVLAKRAAALQALIQENPHSALSFAFSPELLADLATKFPDSAAYLESHVTASGAIEHWVMDSPDLKTSAESWFIGSGGTKLNLHFSGTERPDMKTSAVTIEGVRVGSDVAVSKLTQAGTSSSTLLPVIGLVRQKTFPVRMLLLGSLLFFLRILVSLGLTSILRVWAKQVTVCAVALFFLISNPLVASAQNLCSTTGAQNVAVLIVNFQDATVAVTPQQVSDIFFDTSSGHSLNGYWQEASYNQTLATGNVFGPYTIGNSSSYSCLNMTQMFDDAVAAATLAGANLQNYTRFNIVFPGLSCGWAGVTSTGSAGAGCNTWSTPAGTLTASVSYLISSYLATRDKGVILAAHENGHQLGLDHAGTVTDEPSAVLGPSASPGTIGEFNDFFSVMGAWTLATYSAQHKSEILNWMTNGSNYQLVQTSGTYTLQPLEMNPPGLQGLKVQRGTGNTGEYLWIEYRQPVGNYDSTISFMNFSGALIHYEYSGTGKHTNVVDFTASDVGSWYNTVLAPGQTWTDPYSNVSIGVQSATANGLTVSVNYGGTSSCSPSAPTVNVAPLNPSIYPGQTAGYSVSVTNNDSSGCASSTISLASTEPSGWSTSLSSSTITLNPGQSASVSLGKGAPANTTAGTYAVNLTASSSAANMTDTANATVVAAPSLSAILSVAGSSFSRPGTVAITAGVTNGGSTVSGANVGFTVVSPGGNTFTQSATTNSSGIATWNFKLSQKSQIGSYSVSAQASLISGSRKNSTTQTVSTNKATFTVQ
ncbi:MAG TPA: NEW3 domain-containing protein [Candidatus Acidoferrum sp.]|jgi:M6 family metalloprotease-like protein